MNRKLKILILDDVSSDMKLSVRELQKNNVKFVHKWVSNKEAFIKALQEYRPDLILSDYSLPGFDGMSALGIAHNYNPDIPFIILTGSMNEDVAVQCMKAGADDYVIKDSLKRLTPAVFGAITKKIQDKEKRLTEKQQEITLKVLDLLNSSEISQKTIDNIVKLIQAYTQVDAVAIRFEDGDDFPYISASGFNSEFVKVENCICGKDNEGNVLYDEDGKSCLECMCGKVIRGKYDRKFPFFSTGGSFWTNNADSFVEKIPDQMKAQLGRCRCKDEGFKSIALIPLRSGSENIGLIQLNHKKINAYNMNLIEFLERLGNTIGIALERIKIKKDLKDSEKKFHDIFDYSGDAIIIFRLNGNIVDVNRIAIRRFGYSKDEFLNLSYRDIIEENRDCLFIDNLEKLAQDRELICETVHVTKEGKKIPTELSSKLIDYEEEKAVLIVARDISSRKIAERRLRESEARFRSFVENAELYAIYSLAKTDEPYGQKVHTVSSSLGSIVGLNSEEIMNLEKWFENVHPEDLPRVMEANIRGFHPPYEFNEIMRYYHPEKGLIWLQVVSNGILSEDGELDYINGIIMDITDKMLAQDRVRYLNRNLVAIRNVNQLIVKEKRSELLLQSICDTLVETGAYKGAVILLNNDNLDNDVFWSGTAKHIDCIKDTDKCSQLSGCLQKLFTLDDIQTVMDLSKKCKLGVLDKAIAEFPWMIAPLNYKGKKIGAIGLSLLPEMIEDEQEVLLLEEVADDIAYALENIKIEEQHHKSRQSFMKLNEVFLSLGSDHQENINQLTKAAGELLKADCALYNKIENNLLCSCGIWNAPPDYNPVDKPLGHICTDVIMSDKKDGIFVLQNLQQSSYRNTDPNVKKYGLETYIGHPVSNGKDLQGVICLVYVDNVVPDDTDKKILGIIASAIWQEEEKHKALIDLKDREASMAMAERLARVGGWKVDVETDKLSWTDEHFRIFGLEPGEDQPSSQDFLGYIFPEDRKEILSAFEDAIKYGKSYFREIKITRKDGVVRTLGTMGKPKFDDSGKVIEVEGAIQDITDLKAAEDELKKSREKYRDLIENLNDIVFTVDARGKIEYISPIVENLTGFNPEELIGTTFAEHIYPDDLPQVFKTVQDNLQGIIYPVVFRVHTKSGGYRWVRSTSRPIISNGKTIGLNGMITDVTEIKLAEQEMEKQKKLLNNIISNLPHCIFWKDRQSVYLGCNDNFARVVGLNSSDEIIGKTDYDLNWTEEQARYYRQVDLEVMETSVPKINFTESQFYMDGRNFHVLVSKVPLRDAKGEVFGVLGIYADITEIKEAEKALKESEKKFRQFFENEPDYCYMISPEGIILDVNQSALEALGYTKEELVGQPVVSTLYTPESQDKARSLKNKWVSSYSFRDEELEILTKSGETRSVLLSVESIADDTGKVIHSISVQHDITDLIQIKRQLKEKDLKLTRLMDNLPGFVYTCKNDSNWTMKFISDGFEELTGYKVEDVINNNVVPFVDLVHPDDLERMRKTIEKAIRDEEPFQITYRVLTLSGKIRWLWEQGIVITDDEPGEILLEGYVTDITDRRKTEEALRETEERYKVVIDNIETGIVLISPEMRILAVNRKIEEWFPGLKPLGQFCFEAFYEGRGDICPSCKMLDTLSRGITSRYQRNALIKGQKRFFEITATPVMDSKGRIIAAIEMVEDVTERIDMESKLRFLSAAVEQATDSVVIFDLDGTIEYANYSFEAMSGYAQNEIVGGSILHLLDEEHHKELVEEIWDTISAGESWKGSLVNLKKNGEPFEEDSTIFPIKTRDGRIKNFAKIARDVTEQKKLENQLRQAQKMEAIGRLAGGIAHDFNNLLTAILVSIDMAMADAEKESLIEENLLDIQNSSEKAVDLVGKLLTFSREKESNEKPIMLNAAVQNVDRMIRRVIGEDITLVTTLSNEEPIIRFDKTQLDQIIMNLVVNARDAMPDGGRLEISTGFETVDEESLTVDSFVKPGNYVVLNVKDCGMGMDLKTTEQIFEPFFTTKEKGKGTGLGLATVYGIIKKAGGYIRVNSEPGAGTEFRIYLQPCYEEVEAEKHKTEELTVLTGSEYVLVVDDDTIIRKLVKRTLEKAGYMIETASKGAEAKILFTTLSEKPAVLITDVVLPDTNGIELAGELKKRYPELKTIYMSGYDKAYYSQNAVIKEDDLFINKPFKMDQLLTIVRRAIDQ